MTPYNKVNHVYINSASKEHLSRHVMVFWVNGCLESEFSKIEQLHTGAAYCLFTHILFPGSIQLKRVKWNSRQEMDTRENWKLVRAAWIKVGIHNDIPVDKLIKGKFQDNFEFIQWFKLFFEANYDGHPYNAVEARGYEPLPSEDKIKPGAMLLHELSAHRDKGIGAEPSFSTKKPVRIATPSTSGKSSKNVVTMADKKTVFTTTFTGRQTKQEEPLTPVTNRTVNRVPTPFRVPICDLNAADETVDAQAVVDKSSGFSFYYSPQVPPPPPPTPVQEKKETEVKLSDRKLRVIKIVCQANEVIGYLLSTKILEIVSATSEQLDDIEKNLMKGKRDHECGGHQVPGDDNGNSTLEPKK